MLSKLFTVMLAGGLTVSGATGKVLVRPQRVEAFSQTHHRYEADCRPGQAPRHLAQARALARNVASADSDSNIFGYLGWSTQWGNTMGDTPSGIYSLPFDAQPELYWPDERHAQDGNKMQIGWLQDDKLCGIVSFTAMYKIEVYQYVEYDFNNGDLLLQKDIKLTQDNIWAFLTVGAYNENDGYVYGYGLAPDGFNYAWTKAPADDIAAAECIKPLTWENASEQCVALCYNSDDNVFYGLNGAKQIVEITPDGTQTVLAETPMNNLGNYNSGMVYSQRDKAIIINFNMIGDSSSLYMVNLDVKEGVEFIPLVDYDYAQQFLYFLAPYNMYDPSLPSRPEMVSESYADGSLEGEVTVTMPDTWADGEPMTGAMTLVATLDDAPCQQVETEVGKEVSLSLPMLRGTHVVRLYAEKDGKRSRALYFSKFFGDDNPAMPQEVDYTLGDLTWDKVTEGQHGGYMDASKVVYHAFLDGQEVAGSPLTGTTLAVEIPTDQPYAAHYLSVVAESNGYSSEPGVANPYVCGQPLDLDVSILPTPQQVPTVKVGADDGDYENSWHDYTDYDGQIWFLSGSKSHKMSDWLFLPPINFDSAVELYSVSLDAALSSRSYKNEYFEIYVGKQPRRTAMTQKVLDTTAPTTYYEDGCDQFSGMFSIKTPGTYYIGIKCVSDTWQWGLLVRNILVQKQEGGLERPMAPTGIKAVAADKGELKAAVTFTAPEQLLTTADIPSEDELEATVTGAETVTVKCHAGETVTVDVPTLQGTNTISVACSYNGQTGMAASTTVYTGVDVPAPVTDLQGSLTEDGLGIKLTWTPPTIGDNGGYIDPDKLMYKIMVMENSYYIDEPIDTYTIRMPEGTPQGLVYFGVVSRNVAGESNTFNGSHVILGQSYDIPATEDFADNVIDYSPVTVYGGTWKVDHPGSYVGEANAEDYALIGNPGMSDPYGRVALPRFSTIDAEDAYLTLNLWNGNGSGAPVCNLSLMLFGQPDLELGSFTPEGTGWTTATIKLPAEALGRQWVWPFIYVESYGSASYPLMISSYEINGQEVGISETANGLGTATYYDLLGHHIERPGHGIYIMRQGTKAVKVRL